MFSIFHIIKNRRLIFGVNRLLTAEDFLIFFKQPTHSVGELLRCFKILRQRICNIYNGSEWLEALINNGTIQSILKVPKLCHDNGCDYDDVLKQWFGCILEIMDHKIGMRFIWDCPDIIPWLVRGLELQNVRTDAAKVLSILCSVFNGQEVVLKAITDDGESKNQPRFLPIVNGLRPDSSATSKIFFMELINALLLTKERNAMEFQMVICNELFVVGLSDYIDNLRKCGEQSVALNMEMRLFDATVEENLRKFYTKNYCDETTRNNFDNLQTCLEIIKKQGTPLEKMHLLLILQHILFRHNNELRPLYYKMIEDQVTQDSLKADHGHFLSEAENKENTASVTEDPINNSLEVDVNNCELEAARIKAGAILRKYEDRLQQEPVGRNPAKATIAKPIRSSARVVKTKLPTVEKESRLRKM